MQKQANYTTKKKTPKNCLKIEDTQCHDKTACFVITGRLPGMNEYTKACRGNRYSGNQMKQKAETEIMWAIRRQLKGWTAKEPVYIKYKWIEPDERRDKDNIVAFGHKVIQDALVKMNVLADDGWDYITGFRDDFGIDKKNPRIEVEILEVEDDGRRKTTV